MSNLIQTTKKANMNTVTKSKADSQGGLVEKAKELVEKVTGQE